MKGVMLGSSLPMIVLLSTLPTPSSVPAAADIGTLGRPAHGETRVSSVSARSLRTVILGDSLTKRTFAQTSLASISRASGIVTAVTTNAAAAIFYPGMPLQIDGQNNQPTFIGDRTLISISGRSPPYTLTWADRGVDEFATGLLGTVVAPTQLADIGWFTWLNSYLGLPFDLVHNSGHSGDLTSQMRDRIQTEVVPYNPDVVFLMAGENDLLHGQSPNSSINAFNEAIRMLIDNTHARIFVLPPPPVSSSSMRASQVMLSNFARLRDLQAQVARRYSSRVRFVDIYPVMVDPASPTKGVANVGGRVADGIHISAYDAQLIAIAAAARLRSEFRFRPESAVVNSVLAVDLIGLSSAIAGAKPSSPLSGQLPVNWTAEFSGTGNVGTVFVPKNPSDLGSIIRIVAQPRVASVLRLGTASFAPHQLKIGGTYNTRAQISASGLDGSTLNFVRVRLNCQLNGTTVALAAWGAASNSPYARQDFLNLPISLPTFTVPAGATDPELVFEFGFSGSGPPVVAQVSQVSIQDPMLRTGS